MELRQLEYFVAVAEEANFTRAAERVHISQSGVSAQIQQLERDLGATLIDRSGRSATLTAAGAAALEHARAALASAAAVRQAVDEVSGLIRGRLVVGMVTACTVTGLFDALATLRLAHPGVEITLIEDNSDRLIESVRSGAADLALIGTAEPGHVGGRRGGDAARPAGQRQPDAAFPYDAVELVVVQEPQRLRLPDLRELGHRRRIALDVAPAHGETHHRVEGADVVVDRLRREPGVSQPRDEPFGVGLDDLGDEHVAEQRVDVLAEMP